MRWTQVVILLVSMAAGLMGCAPREPESLPRTAAARRAPTNDQAATTELSTDGLDLPMVVTTNVVDHGQSSTVQIFTNQAAGSCHRFKICEASAECQEHTTQGPTLLPGGLKPGSYKVTATRCEFPQKTSESSFELANDSTSDGDQHVALSDALTHELRLRELISIAVATAKAVEKSRNPCIGRYANNGKMIKSVYELLLDSTPEEIFEIWLTYSETEITAILQAAVFDPPPEQQSRAQKLQDYIGAASAVAGFVTSLVLFSKFLSNRVGWGHFKKRQRLVDVQVHDPKTGELKTQKMQLFPNRATGLLVPRQYVNSSWEEIAVANRRGERVFFLEDAALRTPALDSTGGAHPLDLDDFEQHFRKRGISWNETIKHWVDTDGEIFYFAKDGGYFNTELDEVKGTVRFKQLADGYKIDAHGHYKRVPQRRVFDEASKQIEYHESDWRRHGFNPKAGRVKAIASQVWDGLKIGVGAIAAGAGAAMVTNRVKGGFGLASDCSAFDANTQEIIVHLREMNTLRHQIVVDRAILLKEL